MCKSVYESVRMVFKLCSRVHNPWPWICKPCTRICSLCWCYHKKRICNKNAFITLRNVSKQKTDPITAACDMIVTCCDLNNSPRFSSQGNCKDSSSNYTFWERSFLECEYWGHLQMFTHLWARIPTPRARFINRVHRFVNWEICTLLYFLSWHQGAQY